jgi:hypothetical protein
MYTQDASRRTTEQNQGTQGLGAVVEQSHLAEQQPSEQQRSRATEHLRDVGAIFNSSSSDSISREHTGVDIQEVEFLESDEYSQSIPRKEIFGADTAVHSESPGNARDVILRASSAAMTRRDVVYPIDSKSAAKLDVSESTSQSLPSFNTSPSVSLPVSGESVNDLERHAIAFFSLLATYSIARVAHSNNETTVAGKTSVPSDMSTRPNTKKPRPSSCDHLYEDDSHEASGSEGEKEPPNQKRKRDKFSTDVHERSLACPLYKLDSLLYAKCKDWSCGSNRIETVKRHVLGQKHLSSPHLNEVTRKEIKGLGVFKTNEDRWKAIYMRIAGIHRDDLYLVPNSYHEATLPYVDGAHLAAPPLTSPGPLPFDWEDHLPEGTPQPLPLNPHSEAFVIEALRLQDLYMERHNEIRSQTATRIEAQQQVAMNEQQRRMESLWADQQASFRNLASRFYQGLPPETVGAESSHVLHGKINTTPPNVAPALFPPFKPGSTPADQRESGDAQGERSFDAMPVSRNALPFLSDDSGYGTMTEAPSCINGVQCWCDNCANRRGEL